MLYFYECLACCTSMHSYICIVASHLGTIDESYEGRATGAEPEDDVGGHILNDGWMEPDVHDQRKMLAKRVSSN